MASIWMDFCSRCRFRCRGFHIACYATVTRCTTTSYSIAPGDFTLCNNKRLQRGDILSRLATLYIASTHWQKPCAFDQCRFLWAGTLSVWLTPRSGRFSDDGFLGMALGKKYAGDERLLLGLVHSFLARCSDFLFLCYYLGTEIIRGGNR